VASLSLRFVFPLISLEGEGLWKIRSAPINPNQLIFKRLTIYFIFIFLLGQLISFFSTYQFPTQLAVVSHVNSALTSITLISLNFGMGGLFANYKEKNAIRLSSSQGASITFLFTLLYLVLLIVILFIPVSDFFYYYQLGYNYSIIKLLYSSLILLVIAVIVWILSIKVAFKAFSKDV
jgi:ABC-2 type transport system permease protein